MTVSAPEGQDSEKEAAKPTSGKQDVEDLSEADQQLRDAMEASVAQLHDASASTVSAAVDKMGTEIRTATTSMTSVPKPLKFLRPKYDEMKAVYDSVPSECQQALADVISVLATVSSAEGSRESLKFRLKGAGGDPGEWGHEYLRHLATEIAAEFNSLTSGDDTESTAHLMHLVKRIVPHHMQHNAEPEAVDLLLEVDDIASILEYVDDKNSDRTCVYLTSVASYLSEPDDMTVLRTAFDIYMKVSQWHTAMRLALRMSDRQLCERVFNACEDGADRQQLAYLLARQGVILNVEEGPCRIEDETLRESVQAILFNSDLSERYLALARDLDVMEPKLPEDIYKMHLVDTHRSGIVNPAMDSALKNLSATLVNALVNVGFGKDKLATVDSEEEGKMWVLRNKDQGKICASASIGMISMWDMDGGIAQVDRFTYAEDQHVVAGACLGFGLASCSVRSELDPAYALLTEHVSSEQPWVRICAVMGLGLSYAGTSKGIVSELLLPLVDPSEQSTELVAHAVLALGLIYVATCDGDVVEAILAWLMSAADSVLETAWCKFVVLGLAFLFLGQGDAVEPTLEIVQTLDARISKFAAVTLDTCAYAGSGNVLKVQEMLAMCGEHIEAEDDKEWQTAHLVPATLGVALIAMGEDLGSSMAMRQLEHLLAYGDPVVRAAVPLALGLLNASRPEVYTMDTLSRLSHDQDNRVARAALLSLGVLGAGTNNARLAGMLRALSSYYYKDAPGLHLVRVAQGLLHLGKGLNTISPFHSDRQLMSHVALAALLTILHCGAETGATLCGKHAFMLYYIAPAIRPRFLITVDEEGRLLPVSVRVGRAVDTVAQAGKPKSITGFQTHDTPVLLAAEDRAELATEKYVAVTSLLEGVVIMRPNPRYTEGTD